jgi:predicted PurR-regulated permease PerM
MPPRSPFPLLATPSEARTATLQGLLIATIVIAALYFGREVLLPLALAILLSFVLTPPLLALRRFKVPRVIAVGIVVTAAFAVIFRLGWLMSREATNLAADLPKYRATLSEKVESFRQSTSESQVLRKAGNVLTELQEELAEPVEAPPEPPAVGKRAEKPDDKPIPVQIAKPEPTGWALYQTIFSTVLPPLATAGIVLLLVIFILLQREDLRDRLIRLFGGSDLQRATSTMSDAATRLSRYFLSQVLINFAYGALIAGALWLIGLPSPIAWGILAMLMRFVPYVGGYIAAAFPLLIAAAIDPGWTTFVAVLVLFLVGELTMGQVVEPMVFGRGTGVTPIAVIASTIFWTWLWGPLGLLIAMPITVCLAVLGRHVEGLQFFEVLLSDEPALTPHQRFYQRALTGDAAEATYHAEMSLKEQSLASYLDTVALAGLKLAEHDARRGVLDEPQIERVAGTVKEMLENLDDFEPHRWFHKLRKAEVGKNGKESDGGLAALEAEEDSEDAPPMVERAELAPGWAVDVPVLSIGGRSPLDEAAAAILAEVLKKRGLGTQVLGPEAISPGHITSLANTAAKLVCLSYVGIGEGPAHIRYLVRRLRRILPQGTLILVSYFAEEEHREAARQLLEEAEADACTTSLEDAVELCINAAKGELKPAATPPPPPGPAAAAPPAKPKREASGKSRSAVA